MIFAALRNRGAFVNPHFFRRKIRKANPFSFVFITMKTLFYLSVLTLTITPSYHAAPKPNIVLILLDDSGWTDFGCYGSDIETPNIDQLANEGMRFTDCHSAAPNCSPARVGLLTGRTPSRTGMYSYRPPDHAMHLRSEEITIAELLKTRGYHTGHFGKWHLSTLLSKNQATPKDQGFDHSLGTDNNASPTHRNPKNFVRNGQPVGETNGYSCQIVVDEAIAWMNTLDADEPFFTCVWYHEPHTPIASPEKLIKKYQKKFPDISKREATYYANIENVDRATGRLLEHIQKRGQTDHTLIFITSDNGGINNHSVQGLRGRKSNLWEGGHRVPGIFRWPGKVAAGTTCDVPISGVDLLPTVCEITNTPLPTGRKIDGTSLAGLLTGKSGILDRKTPLYWFFYRLNPALALRDGKWVLLAETNDAQRPKTHSLIAADIPFIKKSKPAKFMLYNLESELNQRTEVSQQHPEVLDRLKKSLEKLHADVVAEGPAWKIPSSDRPSKPKIWNSY